MYFWQDDAACGGMNTEMFFSEDEERPSYARTLHEAAAKAVCAPCVVRNQCLTAALVGDEVGVWGGTSTQQRRKIKRIGARASCVRCRSRQIDAIPGEEAQLCLECGLTWRK